jgi:hypothetical protein
LIVDWDGAADHLRGFFTALRCHEMEVWFCVDAFVFVVVLTTGVVGLAIVLADPSN